MKQTIFVLLVAGMVFLSSCGRADTQNISESIQKSAESAEKTVSDTTNSDQNGEDESDSKASADETETTEEAESNVSEDKAAIAGVEINFDFLRMPTQASNQVAVWIEDENGKVIKTIYVSDFTGTRRGYQKRKDAVPHWVAAADPSALSDGQIDTVSRATLQDGEQSFVWDLTDDKGNAVSKGKYTIKVEGTLFWSSNVMYSGSIDTEHDVPGTLEVQEDRSEPSNTENEDMIQNVKMTERGTDND